MENGKKMSLYCFLADQIIVSVWKKNCCCFLASYSTSNAFLFVARHTLWAFKNAFKVGTVNFANSLSPPSTVKKVCTASKNSQGTQVMQGKSQGG